MLLKVILRSASVFDLSLRNCFRWLWRTLVQRWQQRRILISSTRSVVAVIAASVRLQHLSGEWQSGGSASFPSSTGLSSNTSWPGPRFTWLLPPGFTITSSTRTGSPCLWEATLPFSSTTDPWAPGCGTANSILTISKWDIILFGQCYVDYIQRTTITWCHQVRSQGPQHRCHKSVTRRNPSSRFLLFAQKFILLNDSGVHSVDFSNVRDDKCHVGVGQSRVRSIKQMSPNPYTGCFFNWYPP